MIKISIITICLNDLFGLKKTCPSVLNQNYENIEYIIVDGGSTDGTVSYVESLCDSNPNIVFISEPDDGRSDAFNKGTKIATGELLLFLNSSDFFLRNDIVSKAVEEWNQKPVDILGYSVLIDTGSIMYANDSTWETGLIPHQGMFIRKEVLEKVGLYNKYLTNRMDYDLCLKFVKEGCTHRFIDDVIVQYDSSGISTLNYFDSRIEGLGLELMYKKSISKDDVTTFLDLYYEKSSDSNVESLEDVKSKSNEKYDAIQKRYTVMRNLLNMMCNGNNPADFLVNHGIKRVSIYGMGDVGKILYKLISNSGIEIPYCIDRDEKKKIYGVELKKLESVTDDIQAIIISNVVGIEKIKESINEYIACDIYSIFDLL